MQLQENWERTKQRFINWWNHEGLVIANWYDCGAGAARFTAPDPGEADSWTQRHSDIEYRMKLNLHNLSKGLFLGESLPVYDTMMGPGSLAAMLGSEPEFSSTVWFHPCWNEVEDLDALPEVRLDRTNRWFQFALQQARRAAEKQHLGYAVGLPDLVENIDVLSSLRGNQTLLLDMYDNPEWVERKVKEINQAWFEVYDALYDICKLEDGSSVFTAFQVWGPGKVAKVQCDACAMFGPDVFERFVVPGLEEQCEWLDYSIYHLDGHECIRHLDLLLEIDALDAIEWTPDPNVPKGGDPCWYPMYKKIKEAGKSVQAIGITPDQVKPLLDAIGPEGVYIMPAGGSEEIFRQILDIAAPYYKQCD